MKSIHVEARIGEVNRLIANSAKARDRLGWDPNYDLDKGLHKFVQWYRNYGMVDRIKI
jgi:dTDP-D-glucose 4,6-dehydratase